MSTITVVRKNGAIAIAADTLTSFGPRKLSAEYNRQPSKIFRLGASFVGLAGWSVHRQVLERAFRSVSEPPPLSSVAEIFDVLLALHPRLKQEYFLVPRGDDGDAYEVSHLNLLIANQHGIFSAHCVTSPITSAITRWVRAAHTPSAQCTRATLAIAGARRWRRHRLG